MEQIYENGELIDSNIQMGNYTTYPSAFLVVDPDGIYSKHYYAGTQRIAARMGQHNADELFEDKKKTAKLNGTDSTDNTFNPEELKTLQQKDLQLYLDKAGKVARLSFKKYKSGESEVQEQQQENENNYVAYGAMAEELIYYYHPDHLGTATYLTDINGEAYEFFLNLPFGETMAEQHSMTADYQNRFKFTGHELDKETGLYYANMRYFDPKLSIFLSVDMLAEQAPGWTPYRYGFNNPIRYTDPTGMFECDGCPDNATKGDVFNHPDWGEVTYNGQNWGNEQYGNIINSVSIEGTTNNSDLSTATTTAQLSGGMLFNTMRDISKNLMEKSHYHIGSNTPLNSIDFNNQTPPLKGGAGIHLYEKGYKESIKQMSNLNKISSVGVTTLNGLGYIHGGVEFYNGNYVEGTNAVTSNTISIVTGRVHGWKLGLGYGLLYTASYSGWEALLTRSESYNRAMHGENSPIYKSRRHHWIKKSKLYTGEQ